MWFARFPCGDFSVKNKPHLDPPNEIDSNKLKGIINRPNEIDCDKLKGIINTIERGKSYESTWLCFDIPHEPSEALIQGFSINDLVIKREKSY